MEVVLFIFIFCFVLFCFVLFCFVLFCFVLFCFVLFCFVLFCFVLFCFVSFSFILFVLFVSFTSLLFIGIDTFDSESFAKFRDCDLVAAAIEYAHEENFKAMEVLSFLLCLIHLLPCLVILLISSPCSLRFYLHITELSCCLTDWIF